MKPKPLSVGSVLASGALALVVMLVFFVLQDYGPESAVRRFHEAIVRHDNETLKRVTKGSLETEVAQFELTAVEQVLKAGARYQLVRTDHRAGWVGAEVVYRSPNGQTGTIYWVVVKDGPTWKVDPEATRDQMSMPRAGSRQVVGFNTAR